MSSVHLLAVFVMSRSSCIQLQALLRIFAERDSLLTHCVRLLKKSSTDFNVTESLMQWNIQSGLPPSSQCGRRMAQSALVGTTRPH
ncbi:hypothetical protein PoB_000466200 [Plakobranchus ocellatus]|uniref:Secreted protein n=1 Tax=Plakobranchus ocellatus TaxID=259542 RepID=A0AAV3Y7R6_9GAST|nr:hypothetical protein PoB_000466200 [Plakobranchus ocellatus]